MDEKENQTAPAIRKAFERELNQHGFAFQHALINQAKTLFQVGLSKWEPLLGELPVNQGPGTKIDSILKGRTFGTEVFLVGECKRVNPAFADWCFVSAPFTHDRRRRNYEYLSLECLTYDSDEELPQLRANQRTGFFLDRAYQIGLGSKGRREAILIQNLGEAAML